MSSNIRTRGQLHDDLLNNHIARISLPPDAQLHTLHTDHTFLVKLSGIGSRSVKPEAIMGALVTRGYIPTEVATQPNIDWYLEEETGNRCFVVKEGLNKIPTAINGAWFEMEVSGPNLPTGHTVRVDVIHSSSKENTFRLEYVPYLADEDLVTYIASFFCRAISANVDSKRKDVWWVKTSSPVEELPHWIIAENLISNVPQNRLLISVKDRDVQCFYCRDTQHWTNRCRHKKAYEKEERQKVTERKKAIRQQQVRANQGKRQNDGRSGKQQEGQRRMEATRESIPSRKHRTDGLPSTPQQSHRTHIHYDDYTSDEESDHPVSPEARRSFHSAHSPSHTSSTRNSPNSAQIDPKYPPSASSGSITSAQRPKIRHKNTCDNAKTGEEDVDPDELHDVSWQQEVIDTLSPVARKREVVRKIDRDLTNIRQRQHLMREASIARQEENEQKRDKSLRKQKANEESQRQASFKKKEQTKLALAARREEDAVLVVFTELAAKERLDISAQGTKPTTSSVAKALFNDYGDHPTISCSPARSKSLCESPTTPERENPQRQISSEGRPKRRGPSLTSTPLPASNPTERKSSETSEMPQHQEGDTSKKSLLDFYASDPESGLSKIIRAIASPRTGKKRANDLSTSHDDAKRLNTADESLKWDNESFRLTLDRDPKPAPENSSNKTTEKSTCHNNP